MELEMNILNWIQSIRTPLGDVLMPLITKLGDVGMIWILLAIILAVIPETRKNGAILAAALCVDFILCNGILKHLFRRMRPCDINSSVQLLITRPVDSSFPSGHTAAAFAAVTALDTAGARKLWKSALALAVFIAFSRLYLFVHYPTDILGGVIVGVAAGYIGSWIVSWSEKVRKNQL